jgi:hypothetical protein
MRTVRCNRCMWCGQPSILEVPDDVADKAAAYLLNRRGFGMIQDEFPTLNAGQREQLMTGTHPACFDDMFVDDE